MHRPLLVVVAALASACYTSSTSTPPITPTATPVPPVRPGPPFTDLAPDLERPLGGSPAPVLDAGLAAYTAKRYDEAARACGDELDNPDAAVKERAQTCVAKSLFRLGLYLPALAILDEIVQAGPGHRDSRIALVWLVAIMRELPDPSMVREAIATYDPNVVDDPGFAREHGDLAFAFGRRAYDHGEFEQAIEQFAKIDETSAYFVKARSIEGATFTRQYDAKRAAATFARLLTYAQGLADPKLASAAITQLARLQFSVAAYPRAIRAYERLELTDATRLELAWAYYNAKDRTKTLATLAPLTARGARGPGLAEAYSLKALAQFNGCEYDAAEATIAAEQARFDPIRVGLEEAVAATEDNTEMFDRMRELVGKTVILDGNGLRTVAQVDELDRERAVHAKLGASWTASTIGTRVGDEIEIQRAFARADAGKMIRDRMYRAARDIATYRRDSIKIKFEILEAKKTALSTGVSACK